MTKLLLLISFIILTGCSKPNSLNNQDQIELPSNDSNQYSSIIFDSTKKTDQNAAEVFDLGADGALNKIAIQSDGKIVIGDL